MFDGLGYPRLVFAGHFQPGHVRDILRSVSVAYRNGGITFFCALVVFDPVRFEKSFAACFLQMSS